MITKERLEELIKQGATVYSTHWKEEIDLSQKCEVFNKTFYDGKKRLVLIVHEDEEHNPHYLVRNLTEDVEGAKWAEEFGCIERTERLELPTWEEFNEKKFVWFFDKYHKSCCLHYLDCSNQIFINGSGDVITIGDLTKENYTLACRKAKELFLGEKDE